MYSQFRPVAPLNEIVETIWLQEGPGEPDCAPTRIMPTGRIEFVFQYGEPFEHFDRSRYQQLADCHIVGLQTEPIEVRPTGSVGLAIVRCKPWAAERILGAIVSEIGNQIIDSTNVWPKSVCAELGERLFASCSQEDRFSIVQEFLMENILDKTGDELVVRSIERMNQAGSQVQVKSLAAEIGISRRHLSRRFRNSIGIPAKSLQRIIRAQKAVSQLMQDVDTNEIVMTCGFSDQSHMIRDVLRFSKLMPTEIRRRRPTALQNFFNGGKSSEYCGVTYV